MSKQLAFYIEQDKCTGCKACQMACKDKNDLEVGQLWREVLEMEEGGFSDKDTNENDLKVTYFTLSCNHCLKPACVEACPTGAMTKREEDGVVYVNLEECIGCKACEAACPYDSPVYNPEMEKMGKCDMCMDLIDRGQDPVCVGACPVRALHYGDLKELQEKYGKVDQVNGLPEPETRPAIVISPHRDGVK